MYCKDCGEVMEGDGFSVVVHCPNADFLFWYDKEPDAAPVHCENMNEPEESDESILPQI